MQKTIQKKVFVIAEIANSHEGKVTEAKKIIRAAANAKADAVKFQKIIADELAESNHENYQMYKNLEMTDKEWKELIQFSKKLKMKFYVDVFGLKGIQDISKLKIDGIKIHSTDISNPKLLKFATKLKIPILLSTAGCTLSEIDYAVTALLKNEIILMHSFQGYPTELKDLNLQKISLLKEKFALPIGLMDHISGDSKLAMIVPLLGIGLGTQIIEKHITLDRSKKGLDYFSALNPNEFLSLVSLIKKSQIAMGEKSFELGKNELQYRLLHKKNAISKKVLKKNTIISESMIEFKRTKLKKEPLSFSSIVGKKCIKDIPKNTIITKSLLKNSEKKIVAVLACRVDSNRLFAKPLQLIGKFRILELLINQIKKSKLITEIILAISNKPGNEIFIDFAQKNKLKFILGDDIDVLKRLIDATKYLESDIIFRVTPENPFIYWEGIDDLIKKHISGKYDLSMIEGLPIGSNYEVINRNALEISHKNGNYKHRSELCTLYINQNQKKFKILKIKPPKKIMRPDIRLTVDTPEDLIITRLISKKLGNTKKIISLDKIIEFIDKNPEILKINSSVPLGVSRIWD
jgi:N,N'-diacetyllegionaminate synthase